MKFSGTVEFEQAEVEVEANSKEEASEKVGEMLGNGEIDVNIQTINFDDGEE